MLWFEHDLYDQAVLIRLLAGWRGRPALRDGRVFLICVGAFPGVGPRFVGLGRLTPGQLGGLWGTERPVTAAQVDLAARAWAAYTGDDPLAVHAVAEAGTPELPFLAPALRRHLEELPWTSDGLRSRWCACCAAPRTGRPIRTSMPAWRTPAATAD